MIRPATPEEFPQLLDIQTSCIQGLTDTYTSDEINAWVEYLEKEGANRYAAYSNQVFVDDAKEIAGFVSWSENTQEHSAAIECLYTLPERRGEGIGRLLLQKAENSLTEGATIHIRSTLNARSLYEHHDYRYAGDAVSRAGFSIVLLEKRS